nr:hypothetical protein [Tanacetum cinerariifolium]
MNAYNSLNDLDFATLKIDGQSMVVDAPPDIIDVDEDNDFIDDEDVLPHDLASSDDDVLANDDDEARIQYEEMPRLRDLGASTSTGVPYNADQIIAMVRRCKQRIFSHNIRSVVAAGVATVGIESGTDEDANDDEDANGDAESTEPWQVSCSPHYNIRLYPRRHNETSPEAFRLCVEGSKLRAKGFDVDLTKRIGGRTLLTQKLLGIPLISRAEEDCQRLREIDSETSRIWARPICSLQALGVVMLSLANNVAYNVVDEKTTCGLIKALSNMYEKPSVLNKVFLIRQLVNTKMKEGASVADHVNEFNSILSRLMPVDIKFDDEKTKAGAKSKTEGRSRTKHVASKDKEVHMAVRDYSDALNCCVEITIDDLIMDFATLFHATYCKEELERFRLRFGKVHLVDDKTLDIAGVRDVVLKTSFSTSWTMKDVRYISCLKRTLISLGQFDKEAIDGRGNAALWHQRLGHMSEKGMQILASKGRISYLQKAIRLELVHKKVYGPTSVASIGGSRYYVTFIDDNSKKVKCLKFDNGGEYSSREFIEYCGENGIRMLKTVPKTHQQNNAPERMNQTLNERAKRFRIPKEEWKGKKVSLAHLKGHKVVRSTNVTFNEDSLYGAKAATDSSNLTKPNQKDQVSPGGSSDTSEGSKNNGRFENSGKSDEEDSEDGASFEEGGFETPRESYSEALSCIESVQWKKAINKEISSLKENQTWFLVRIPAGKKALQSKLVLSIVASENLHLEQLDVKTALLHGDIDEDINMAQPEARSEIAEIKKLKRDKTKGTLRLSLEKYIGKVLDKFNMKDAEARCQPLREPFKLNKKQASKTKAYRRRIAKVPYASVVGSLIEKEVVLEGFSDSDYGGCLDSGKSNTSYVFTVGGTTVSWMSRIQKCVTMSTIEAEYIAVAQDSKELVASSCDYDGEDEVASVDNEMANFQAKKDGYDTHSLLEQWTESYENDDYGYDPYDDDMYEDDIDTQPRPSNNSGHQNDESEDVAADKEYNDEADDEDGGEDDEAEDGGQSKEEDDSDDEDKYVEDIIDEEHIVDEVEVQMNGYKFEIEVPLIVKITKEMIMNRGKEIKKDMKILNQGKKVKGNTKEIAKGKKVNVHDKRKGKMVIEEEKDKPECPWVLYISKGDKGKCKTKAFKAKAKAHIHLRGDDNVQYSLLRDYVHELKMCNPNTSLKIDVYGIVTGYFQAFPYIDFNKHMDELKGYNKKAYEWLKKITSEHCSRSHFLERANCDLLINNICDVFNRQLLDARNSPIISALEYVREYLMKRIVIVQKILKKHVVACIHDMANNGMVFPTSATKTQAGTQDASQSASQAGENVVGSQAPATVSQMSKTKKSSSRLIPAK